MEETTTNLPLSQQQQIVVKSPTTTKVVASTAIKGKRSRSTSKQKSTINSGKKAAVIVDEKISENLALKTNENEKEYSIVDEKNSETFNKLNTNNKMNPEKIKDSER